LLIEAELVGAQGRTEGQWEGERDGGEER